MTHRSPFLRPTIQEECEIPADFRTAPTAGEIPPAATWKVDDLPAVEHIEPIFCLHHLEDIRLDQNYWRRAIRYQACEIVMERRLISGD